MRVGLRSWPIAAVLATGSFPAETRGQVAPQSPVHIAVNGVFFLCPHLIRSGRTPAAEELARLGFAEEPESLPDAPRLRGTDRRGLLLVRYEAETKRCIVDYGGPGHTAIAGVIRDTASQNGLARITEGDRGGVKGEVFEGSIPGSGQTARIIIIENDSGPSATISYSHR